MTMNSKEPAFDDTKAPTDVASNSNGVKGTLKSVGGSQSDDWNEALANQVFNMLWINDSDKVET
jgi:hypothetical protein